MIELLDKLQSSGVQVRLDGEQLSVTAPKGVITQELKDLLARHKETLRDLLRNRVNQQQLPALVANPGARHQPFELTDVQHAYWMGRSEYVELGGFSTHFYIELERAGLDVGRLEASLQKVIARHDMLRAVFDENGLQRVLEKVPAYRIELQDLTDRSEDEQQAQIDILRGRMSHNRLSPQSWPLFEIRAVRRPEGRLRLFVSLDMLIIDASSMFMFFEEWQRCYEDPAWTPAPLDISFRDYAEYDRMLQDQAVFHKAKDYWTSRLDALPPAPELPLAVQPRSVTKVEFKRRIATIGAADWLSLKERSRRFGGTPSVLLMAAFSETLRTWSKAPDFTLNVTMFNRLPVHPEVGALLGDFTTTNLLAVHAQAADSFADRMQRLQRQLAQDLEHRHYNGMRVLRDRMRRLGNTPGAAMPVVFTSTLALASQDRSAKGFSFFGDYAFGVSQTPQVWLDHQMIESKGELLLFWDAVEDLFPAGMLDDMLQAYAGLLQRLAQDESAWTTRQPLPMLPAWQQDLFKTVNATATDLAPTTLHAGAALWAQRSPDAPAVITPSGSLTYRELHAHACRLGRWLRQAVPAGAIVAVCMDRGWEQVAAVYGVLHGACAYLPIDPALPLERRRRLLALAGARVVLTQAHLQAEAGWPADVRTLTMMDTEVSGQDASLLPIAQAPEDLAYVLFTSGSTGDPKGVMIEHRHAVNTLQDINRRFRVGPGDRMLGLSAAHFDLSVYDLFGVLAAGATLVLPSPDEASDPAHWTELVRQHGVTLWNSVPQLLQLWCDHLNGMQATCDAVRQVILSGDWIPVTLPDQVRRCCPSASILASGGPTETSIWCTQYPVGVVPQDWKSIPYGQPLSNQTMHVYNDLLEPRAVWVPGEICIGGAGVGRGYLHDEERTAQRFITHPHTGERLYRSGDLGRYLPDGNIEFLGREDFQVKINGYRIELGEIEAVLRRQPTIAEALVTVATHPESRQRQLAAYVVPRGATFDQAELQIALAAQLPAYMVPALYVPLERLPLTANGKLERKSLPDAWQATGQASAKIQPRNDIERTLYGVWRNLLDHDTFGVEDNFFSLGLDSVSMIRMVAQMSAEFGLSSLPQATVLQRLFAGPTIEQLARAVAEWLAAQGLDAQKHDSAPPAAPVPLGSGDQLMAPFSATDLQLGYWTGEGQEMEFPVRANYYVEFGLAAGHEPARLKGALNRALERQRHNLVAMRPDARLEVLREWKPVSFLAVHDLRGLTREVVEQHLRDIRSGLERRLLPLDRWPWLEFRLCLLDDETRVLVNSANHFVDAVTFSCLMEDTQRCYLQPDLALPPLTLTYRDCVLAYKQLEDSPSGQASERYWRDRIPHLPPPPAVPRLASVDPCTPSRLVRREATIAAPLWAAFRRTAARHGVSASVALYGVYAQVLAAWSGSRHFLLANMTSFRHHIAHPEAQQVAGGFGSVYPMEIDLREPLPFHERLKRLQLQQMRDAQHQHWGGGRVWQALNQLHKTVGRAPAPFVVVSGLDLPPWDKPFHGCLETPQVLFDHQFWNLSDGRLWLVIDVNEQHFPPGLVDAFWQAYQALIARLAGDESAWQQQSFNLLPAGQHQIREAANQTAMAIPSGLLHDVLAQAVAKHPGKQAVISTTGSLTYQQLDANSNRLAHRLRECGVTRAEPVVLAIERGAGQMTAVFAVLRAGGAYVPVDPAWPAERIAFVLSNTGAKCIVASQATRATLTVPAGIACLSVDDASLGRYPDSPLPPLQQPQDLAYIIYTSGSTGQPKGVMIDHRGALNTVVDINQRFGVSHGDVVFGISSLTFDLSVYDLFGTVAAGATLVLPAPFDSPQPAQWVEAVRRHGVTVWNSVPSLMQLLIDAARIGGHMLPTLDLVMLSGDWIPVTLPAQIRAAAPNASLYSLGGATEASIWSIHYPIEAVEEGWASIPYGKPLGNQSWHVLAEDGTDAPEWVAGHLHIAGVGLAMGYWRDEAKTAASFVRHPRSGERLYRTGDLGRYLPDGNLEFLGRADHQVKIQGYRIELGEIEHALQSHPSVQSATVLAQGDRGGMRLVAFVVGVHDSRPDVEAWKAHLGTRLPSYMVPQQFVVLPALPLSPNGKVDRAALMRQASAPAAAQPGASAAPRTRLEAELVQIWQQVLGVPRVGIGDDFFDLGGQSFAAIQVMTRIEQRCGQRLPLGELLRARTVERLARHMEAATASSPLVRMNQVTSGVPLFLVHPAGGNVLCYRELAQRLRRPVFGLQAPGLDGLQRPIDDLCELAALYVGAIQADLPPGPCQLAGWSSGGLVAFEMCRQIEAAGGSVMQLTTIDAPSPWKGDPVDDSVLLQWFLQDLNLGVNVAALGAGPAASSLADALMVLNAHRREADQLHIDQIEPIWNVFRAMLRAGQSYEPGPVRSDILVLKATTMAVDEFAHHPAQALPDWGWTPFTTGKVTCMQIPGDHYSIFRNDGMALMSEAMNGPVQSNGDPTRSHGGDLT